MIYFKAFTVKFPGHFNVLFAVPGLTANRDVL